MAPAVEDLLTTFHPSGDAFAITAGDGRIKVRLLEHCTYKHMSWLNLMNMIILLLGLG
jgi:hypothetical protein